jgi:hypothetical protein
MTFAMRSASVTGPEPEAAMSQRPALVWVILTVIAVTVTIMPFSMWTVRSTVKALPIGFYFLSLLTMGLLIAAAVELFRLHATAIRLFMLVMVVAVIANIYSIVAIPLSAYVIPAGMDAESYGRFLRAGRVGGMVFGVIFYGAIVLYLRRLRRRAILY